MGKPSKSMTSSSCGIVIMVTEGLDEGTVEGVFEGNLDGDRDGVDDGVSDGDNEGPLLGVSDGTNVGDLDGTSEGKNSIVGRCVGRTVETGFVAIGVRADGLTEGFVVGRLVVTVARDLGEVDWVVFKGLCGGSRKG